MFGSTANDFRDDSKRLLKTHQRSDDFFRAPDFWKKIADGRVAIAHRSPRGVAGWLVVGKGRQLEA
jgi:hypothetical protein